MATAAPDAVNYWPDSKCARAFWDQCEAPAYQQLLADTTALLEPQPGDRWLDLGCGRGMLSRALWQKSGGTVAEIVGLDCAADNARAYERLRTQVRPTATADRLRFVCADFSAGLAAWSDASFDGVVSGLAIQYAESYSQELGRWTMAAYDHLLTEVHRLLRPGAAFVFSVNVPEPAWARVAWRSLPGLLRIPRRVRFLKRSLRMLRYGRWLKQEARRGRFHYLPIEAIVNKLQAIGFDRIEHRLSFVGQAYLLRCHKPNSMAQGQLSVPPPDLLCRVPADG
ncbi:MAG TPA: methyltransferase domain-containing protein [Gemmataceae bacterium]|nr:methyltransferase domain-containing protein [Gemmataceae bacterium]